MNVLGKTKIFVFLQNKMNEKKLFFAAYHSLKSIFI